MPTKTINDYDIIVVGGGNTALCAALTAHDHGAKVAIIEAAPKAGRGGNSRFSGTAWRFVHNGKDHLLQLLDNEGLKEAEKCSMGPYTAENFTKDMLEKSGGRHDRGEIERIVEHGFDTMMWMKEKGVLFKLPLNFWVSHEGKEGVQELAPGVPVVTRDYGRGLTDAMWAAAEKANIDVFYSTPAHDLIQDGDRILGVRARTSEGYLDFQGKVLLCCGGFEANPRMRRQYLGQGTEMAIVRGTRFNTGAMLEAALSAGAQAQGHWGGYHCAPQDAAAPKMGDMATLDAWERYSFPYSVMVNKEGRRFCDEGEDEISLIYSKVGAAIAEQPSALAFQIFDQSTVHLISEKYRTHSTPIQANTLEELATKLSIPVETFVSTIKDFNSSCLTNTAAFDPFTPDALSTTSLTPPKSNWALPLSSPPYTAYATTVGMTFTFGGISTNSRGQVLNNEGNVMSGLYAMGEMTGGFWYGYAAGASLIRSAVMARVAGRHAAESVKEEKGGGKARL